MPLDSSTIEFAPTRNDGRARPRDENMTMYLSLIIYSLHFGVCLFDINEHFC